MDGINTHKPLNRGFFIGRNMAETEKTAKAEKKSASHKSVLKEALERFEYCQEKLSDSKRLMLEDIKFSIGDSDNGYQWPEKILSEREFERRPALTMNKMPQFINQVVNDARQNRPAIKIRPVDSGADVESAEVLQDLVRNIESVSSADVAYDTAVECAARAGEGYFRIITDYCDETSFNQEILLKRIRNPLSVWLDPDYQEPDGCDAMWGFVIDEVKTEEFDRLYPKAIKSSWDKDTSGWTSDKTVRIAEYFRVVREEKALLLLSDGSTAYEGDELPEGITEVKRRDGFKRKVEWYKLTLDNVLDETEIPCSYIPVIPVLGNEVDVEGVPQRSGLVRNAKDPQRQYNYWVSAETEMIALAPKAPFIGYTGQFKDKKWKDANVKNYAYLEAEMLEINGQAAPLPQRQPFAGVPAGILAAKSGANNDIRETMGMYNASLGAPSQETSGKAILAKQQEADTGTFHYIDNLSRSIRHAGRIIVEMIPKIYDTQRIMRILGEDGEPDNIQIDPNLPQAKAEIKDANGKIQKIFNPNIGKYDVAVTVGPSFASKRVEAAESMMEMTRIAPDILKVAGDVIVRNMDWPGAQDIADRIKRAMPPEIVGEEGEEPIPPKVQAMITQIQQAEQAIGQQAQLLEAKAAELTQKDQELSITETEVKSMMDELKAQDRVMKAEMKAAKAELKMQAADMEAGQEQEAAQLLMRYTEGLEGQVMQLSKALESLTAAQPQ